MTHRLSALVVVAGLSLAATARAQQQGSISGTVTDPLGGVITGASVTLVRDGQRVGDTSTGARGQFTFERLAEGRYEVEARAAGFEPQTTRAVFVGAGDRATVDVGLSIGPLRQEVVVTAAATQLPQAQVGAPVTVIDAATLQNLGNTDLLEPLRTVPGAQVVQTGARGGTTSMFVRGGASNFNKMLIDGVPANDIGGSFDFADLSTSAIDRVEVLRGSNSVLYGNDALTGVISVTTRRGRSRVPELMYSIDGGNLNTFHHDASLGGTVKRFDYFGDFSHLQTDNSVANNAYRNNSFASRFGLMLGATTDLSGTIRRIDTKYGSPSAIEFYGIPDDAVQTRTANYASVAAESQMTDRWRSTIRFGVTDQDSEFVNPTPTGQRSDPSPFANYLGNAVTIRGANGYSATGRAILDFGGTYPSVFTSSITRRMLYGETDYRVSSALDVAGGVRVENEKGHSIFNAGTPSATDRTNYGAFVEARATARGRLYVNGGLGFDHNAIFGFAPTPRVSVAAYLHEPSATNAFGETKLTVNAGKGIKEPSVSQELSSLFALVPAATATALGVSPVGPERSRSADVGIEQGLAGGRGRVRVMYFNNRFSDLIEFVSKNVLPQVGVTPAAAAATSFGAYVNSQSNRARGVESSAEAALGKLRVSGSYTYVDAIVTESFSSGALRPAINPAFPTIPIGAFSPLVGAHPFRRPKNAGSLVGSYVDGKAQVSVAAYFVGQQDDSTFLSDADFGNSLLLPNQNLDAAYQKVDISGSYQIHPRLRWYATIENAFDAKYEAAAGFPALPRAARTGVTITLGGDR